MLLIGYCYQYHCHFSVGKLVLFLLGFKSFFFIFINSLTMYPVVGCLIYSLWFLNSSLMFRLPYLFRSENFLQLLFHHHHYFLLKFLIHRFYTISVIPPYISHSYFSSLYVSVNHCAIFVVVSSSLFIQYCSNSRRLISMTNLHTHHEKSFVSLHI